MNKIIVVGNLTRDVEGGTTQSGVSYARFTVACKRREEVDYLNVVAWRGQADNCIKWLSKGKKVAVSGTLTTRKYESNGAQKIAYEIIAEEVEFLNGGEKKEDKSSPTSGLTEVNEELPF